MGKLDTGKRLQQLMLWLALLLTLVVVARFWLLADHSDQDERQAALREAGIVLLPEPRSLPSLSLLSANEQPVQLQQLAPRWHLVFFGYTFCPDICPTTLAELRRIYQALPSELQERSQVLMVTVDPQRDSPGHLRDYLDFFDKDFDGLTGQLADIQSLSQALAIPFIPGDSSLPNYTVDHSGNLALIGPDGRQHGFIRAPLNVPALIAALPLLLE